MPRKKDTSPAVSPEQAALIKHVDQMMDLSLPDPPPLTKVPELAGPAAKPAAGDKAPIDIFSDSKTAPAVSPELLKEIGVDKPAARTAVKPSRKKSPPPQLKTTPKKQPPPADSRRPAKTTKAPAATDVSYDDAATDQAVDAIVAEDGDKLLALQDAANQAAAPAGQSSGRTSKPRQPVRRAWLWLLIVVVLVAAFIIF